MVFKVPEVAFSNVRASLTEDEAKIAEIRQQLSLLKQKVQETGVELDRCRQEQEAFSVEFYACRESTNRYDAMLQAHGEQNQDVVRLKVEKDGLKRNVQQKVRFLFSKNMLTHF